MDFPEPIPDPTLHEKGTVFCPLEGVQVNFETPFTESANVHTLTDPPNTVSISQHTLKGFFAKVIFQPKMIERQSVRTVTDVDGNPFQVRTVVHETPDAIPVAASITYHITGI
jgi:hypothetical protein